MFSVSDRRSLVVLCLVCQGKFGGLVFSMSDWVSLVTLCLVCQIGEVWWSCV